MPDSPGGTPRLPPGDPATANFLLFRLQGGVYAASVQTVREIVLLAELRPIHGHSPWFRGIVNLRGAVVPVLDLYGRLNGRPGSYCIHDKLVVFQCDGRLLGVTADEVIGVRRLALDQQETGSTLPHKRASASGVIRASLQVDDDLVMLLDVQALLDPGEPPRVAEARDEAEPPVGPVEAARLPGIRPEDLAELSSRARQLRQPMTPAEPAGVLPVAVIELGEELFAVEFRYVREFFRARQITPVPCCPSHITGNVNLRGEILTVIDIRQSLNLPFRTSVTEGKVMVVQLEPLQLGVLVDDVRDVVFLRPSHVQPPPAGASPLGQRNLKGAAPYGQRMMGILDLEGILAGGDWVVNENVGLI